jgi:hypothetical protein
MSSRLILAAVAALALASPALAQTAAPAPAAPAAQAAAPTEEDVEAAAEAFEADMQKLAEEIDAVVTAAGDDKAKASAEADILVARHQPVADAFADTLDGFLQSMAAMMPAEQMALMPDALAKIRSAPAEVKAHRLAPPAAAQ